MPNYVTTRLTLAGPLPELTRFQTECIRLQRDDDTGMPSLDLEALVPMPPEIVVTLDDNSDQVQQAALAATGHRDWYSWSIASWGTKWNTSVFNGREIDGMIYDCAFDTAWSCPERALAALAELYPALSGTVVASEEQHGWCLIGTIQNGVYENSKCEFDPQVHLLVRGEYVQGRFADNSALSLIDSLAEVRRQPGASHDQFVSRRLRMIFAALACRQSSNLNLRLGFERAALDVIGLLNGGKSVSGLREESRSRDSEEARNIAFLLANDRARTKLDRQLLLTVATCLREDAFASCDDDEVSASDCRQRIEDQVLSDYDEDDLRAWAAVAMYRPGVLINMGDAEALEESFLDYAEGLRADTLAHLKSEEIKPNYEMSRHHASKRAFNASWPSPQDCVPSM